MTHRTMAEDCWRLIKALAATEDGDRTCCFLLDVDDVDGAAVTLIEMACDSAAESQRLADGHPPKSLTAKDFRHPTGFGT